VVRLDGMQHGKGRSFNVKDGNVFEGDYIEGHRTGKGKMTYTNGDVYEGEYNHDNRKGDKGKYTWAKNGNVYEGGFYKEYMYEGSTYRGFPLVMRGVVHEASTGTIYTAVFTKTDTWREDLTAFSDGKTYTYKSMLYTAQWSVEGGQEGGVQCVVKEGEFLNGTFLVD
jgi:hypothetical protein